MSETVFPLVASLLALGFVLFLSLGISRKEMGTEKMRNISRSIQEGATAFLRREYSYVLVFISILALFIALSPAIFDGVKLSWRTSIAFIIGSMASAMAGYIGMSVATRSNSRTTHAASTGGVKAALNVAVSGGAVMGFSVVGLALLGLVIVYTIFNGKPEIVNGYAMGASLMALFARSGGGIFTKGADMGADLVGKVEAGIPEDDPRNPGVIADNVGDNVGDVAGLGADLLESYVESIIASLALAGVVGLSLGSREVSDSLKMLPLTIASVGIVASIIGVMYVRLLGRRNPQSALMGGTYISAILTIVATFFIVRHYGVPFESGNPAHEYGVMGPFYAILAGVISGVIVGFVSEFFTSSKYSPVRKLARRSMSGPAITVTEGIAVGMESTAIPVLVLAIAVLVSFHYSGMYGVAMAALGMLATTGMIVSVDSYGPIADNAGGIAEMAGLDPSVRKITDKLDAVGNTTAAIGKGFAIGSAAFAAMGLLVAYMAAVGVDTADLRQPTVLAGLLIGGMLPFLFSSQLFRAVSKCADGIIGEVRRQFKEIPGLMEGEVMPDSARCVDISTRAAIHGMMLPGVMAIVVPVVVGLVLGPTALAGLLVGSLVTGLMLGIQTANSGGAMDNAKKYIEEGNFGGKGSDTHKAAVVGDSVGDPLKDTVGPSINILIKLMTVVSLVLAPLFV
jgi:K(+)-stimulated pyrophosphate-energized sodium pump